MSSFVLSQISGLIALFLAMWSYFVENKIKFLIIQIFSNIFYATSFFLVSAVSGGVLTLVEVLRTFYLVFEFKYSLKNTRIYSAIFVVMCVVSTIILWETWLDLIPLVTCLIYIFIYAIKNMQKMRYVLLIPTTLLMIYCTIVTAYTNALLDVFEIITLVMAIVHFTKLNKNIKTQT